MNSFESYIIDFDDLFSILLPELLNLAKKYVSDKMREYEKEIINEIKNKKKLNIFTIDYLSYVSQAKDYHKKYLKYKYKYLEIKKYK